MALVENEVIVNEANDKCWETGIFTDECDCFTCEYSSVCSGSDAEDE